MKTSRAPWINGKTQAGRRLTGSPFVQLFLLNLRPFLRERGVLFWTFAFPLLLTLLFSLAFARGEGQARYVVAVWPTSTDATAGTWSAALAASDRFTLKDLPDAGKGGTHADPEAVLAQEGLDAVIQGDALLSALPHARRDALHDALLAARARHRGDGLRMSPACTTARRFEDWFVPGMVALTLLSGGLFGVATRLATEREQGLFRRLSLAPFRTRTFVLAFASARIAFIVVQSAVLLACFHFLFGFKVQGPLPAFLAICLLGGLCLTLMGTALAARAARSEVATGMANAVYFPMSFLSGVYFEIERYPEWLQGFARALPLAQIATLLRGVTAGSQWWSASSSRAALCGLVVWTLLFLALTTALFRWDNARD